MWLEKGQKTSERIFWIFACFVLLNATGIAQQNEGFIKPKLKKVPEIRVPKVAIESNVGGLVSMNVTVNELGRVTDIITISGPGTVCPTVQREDVIAIRNEAQRVARLAVFEPAMVNGVPSVAYTDIDLEFPVSKQKDKEGPDKYYAAQPIMTGKSDAPSSELSGGVLNGKALNLPKPPYPRAAKAVGASGPVSVDVLIDENGDMFSAKAVSGHPLLRAAAVTAACGAKFTPTKLEGTPVKVAGVITYNFVAP